MKKVIFEVPAKKYFEFDEVTEEILKQIKNNNKTRVILDYENQTAEFVCYPYDYPYDKNKSNFPYKQDDFEAVKELFEEWKKEGIADVIEVEE